MDYKHVTECQKFLLKDYHPYGRPFNFTYSDVKKMVRREREYWLGQVVYEISRLSDNALAAANAPQTVTRNEKPVFSQNTHPRMRR